MSLACARCGDPLEAFVAGRFTFHACRACAAIFAPNDASAHLARNVDEEIATAVTRVSMTGADLSGMPDESARSPALCAARQW